MFATVRGVSWGSEMERDLLSDMGTIDAFSNTAIYVIMWQCGRLVDLTVHVFTHSTL